MNELEATVDYNNLVFTFLKRSLPVYAGDNFTVKPGKTKDITLELQEVPFKAHGYADFPKDGVVVVVKLKFQVKPIGADTYTAFVTKWQNYCPTNQPFLMRVGKLNKVRC